MEENSSNTVASATNGSKSISQSANLSLNNQKLNSQKERDRLYKKWQNLLSKTELSIFRVGLQLHYSPNLSTFENSALSEELSLSADTDARCMKLSSSKMFGHLGSCIGGGQESIMQKLFVDHCFPTNTEMNDVYEKTFMNVLGEGAAQGE
ncbi:hypothetical protein HK096_006265 [Nowakowskiella sp. JEL0078]|nr:hypothetical protein HK096_006265 [Nowakowskiella sp. JEL0078]